MKKWKAGVLLSLCALSTSCSAAEGNNKEFRGWQEMRVIKSDPGDLLVNDYFNEDADTVMLINRRQARLDFFKYLKSDERKDAENQDSPNELPMAPEFHKSELSLDRPPASIIRVELDGDKDFWFTPAFPIS